MNQTKKRLAIIKLAISMTDTETIQLQVLRLGMLKTDPKIREILTLLSEHSYAQAQGLIATYIETPTDTVLQRTSQEPMLVKESTAVAETPAVVETPNPTHSEAKVSTTPEVATQSTQSTPRPVKRPMPTKKPIHALQERIQAAKDKAIIDEFELFIDTPETKLAESTPKEVNYDDLLDISPAPKKMSTHTVSYDSLLNVEAEDILRGNISIDVSASQTDNFFKVEDPKQYNSIEKDTFFDDDIELPLESKQKSLAISDMTEQEKIAQENFMQEALGEKPNRKPRKEAPFIANSNDIKIGRKDVKPIPVPTENTFSVPTNYNAITYIDQKFRYMKNQYPPIDRDSKSFDSVDTLLDKVSSQSYNEKEIEEIIQKTEKLSESSKAEAAQLLLICAATESKYAQFRLARALYSGDLLKKNLAEAFALINRLAVNDNYPEAICDLAQFYENGISVKKDNKKAEELYKEAMELGIHRATNHYVRIHKQNKGFLSTFKNK